MIVYRVCNKDEINKIFSDMTFENIGKFCEINDSINTHLYTTGKKYIHFFKDKSSIFFLDITKDMFISTYDIPDYILEKHSGIGFYYDRINFSNLEEVSEYAIENKLINFDYLLKIEEVLEPIDIEDYIYDDISSKTKTIYLKNEYSSDENLKLTSCSIQEDEVLHIHRELEKRKSYFESQKII